MIELESIKLIANVLGKSRIKAGAEAAPAAQNVHSCQVVGKSRIEAGAEAAPAARNTRGCQNG